MSILNPASVAVVGASADPTKLGHFVLENVISQGYRGKIYPVNPKGGDILDKKAYATVADVPDVPEMAVVVTPAATVAGVMEDCGKKGVKTVVVISAGFGELGTDEGKNNEMQLAEIARKHGMQLIGPNCLGFMRPSIGLNASFAKNLQDKGNVALLSQSGALAVGIMDAASHIHLAFSALISMGNKAMMDECDFLEICEQDPETKVIGLYLESIKDGKRFLEIASRVAQTKHIVLIKSGVSQRGRSAVSSHTGALAGSDSAIGAACKQAGIHRANTAEDFLSLLRVLSSENCLLSSHVAVITNAGGPGILATDAAEREGLTLVSLTPAQEQKLKKILPPAASVHNPIDVLGDALADRYASALEIAAEDPGIDGLMVTLTPQVMTPCVEIAQAVIDCRKRHPLIPIVTSFMGADSVKEAVDLLGRHGIANFPTPEAAMRALGSLRQRSPNEKRKTNQRKTSSVRVKAQALLKGQSSFLSEELTNELFSLYNLPTLKQAIAATEEEAVTLASTIGFPLVAKISSPDILHKTDIGGVRANLQSEDDVRKAFIEIMANAKSHAPEATLNGVLLQQFLPAGDEFIVGALADASFGHLVMAGLGGIYTELFHDVSFRIAPVAGETPYQMLQELKAWKLLLGMRGKKQADIDALARIILQVSQLVTDCPQIKELDLNPVIVREDRVVIADAKIIL